MCVWGVCLGREGCSPTDMPCVVDPTVHSKRQEHVEVQPDGKVILSLAITHPVHHIWLVQLSLQLIPEVPGHCRGRETERTTAFPSPNQKDKLACRDGDSRVSCIPALSTWAFPFFWLQPCLEGKWQVYLSTFLSILCKQLCLARWLLPSRKVHPRDLLVGGKIAIRK